MEIDTEKVKAQGVESLRVLLNAAKDVLDAERVLRENPSEESQQKSTILKGAKDAS